MRQSLGVRGGGPLGIGWRRLGGATLGAGGGAGSPSGWVWGLPREAQGPPTCSSDRRCPPGCGLRSAGPGCSPAEGVGRAPGGTPVLGDDEPVPPLAPCTRTPVYPEDPPPLILPGLAVLAAPGPPGPPASAALEAGLYSHGLRAASGA